MQNTIDLKKLINYFKSVNSHCFYKELDKHNFKIKEILFTWKANTGLKYDEYIHYWIDIYLFFKTLSTGNFGAFENLSIILIFSD